MAKFDPKDHLTKLQGKDYLPVAARILWFVTEVADGSIETEVLTTTPHVVRATIRIGGVVRAVGHGTAPAYDNGRSSWKGRELEKAETAAIGRALAYCGFGTQFAYQDFDEDEHLADTPAKPDAVVRGTSIDQMFDGANPEHQERLKADLAIRTDPNIPITEYLRVMGIGRFSGFKGTWSQLYDAIGQAHRTLTAQATPAPASAPAPQAEEEIAPFVVSQIVTTLKSDGKSQYTVTHNGKRYNAFSRDPFVSALGDAYLTAIEASGTHTIPEILVTVEKNAKGYWNIVGTQAVNPAPANQDDIPF